MIQIRETFDYRPLIPFFIENELEFDEGEEYDGDEIVKCWRADEVDPVVPSSSHLVGGCVLAKREGEYICDGIAVAPEYRKGGLGRELLGLLLGEAKSGGADKVFLVARAPGFFAKSGFIVVPRENAPDFFECFTCPQYGRDCHPEVMRMDV
ncbi:MAG: GNAT family N-acetyltransferase [Clostridiales Family XIII bacterium]|jgi:N-acetylglutamate synthase-like GNAT family acetyltransferase|nr:GNAT family N-acetyltransferase [Clostridiales Family XIII bacterium]